ncbi:Flp pilus assembly protein CpaB [Clostridium felsineum]|uniref:Flp pilus assembly protein CpaB n=1 Tax=Clostridium felsineum TaxID=36839 RepID=UPI00098CA404|nr:SAF domain-containing protein [Clostridium felsineum]URZ15430.1 hypothetical protein CLFE_014700 [Clostridium felsineum DSM 794]
MHFRVKTLIGTVFIATALFGTLIYIEDKAVNKIPKTEVLVATKDINQGNLIKESDFKKVQYSSSDVNDNDIKNFDDIKDKYALSNLYKGETINKNRIADKDDNSKIFLKKNEKEISIPINKINGDVFAGTLRKGDVVDIAHTVNNNTQGVENQAQIDGRHVKILGAVDSQGKFLNDNDKNVVAASILIAGSEDEFIKISGHLSSGYFTIAKSSIAK